MMIIHDDESGSDDSDDDKDDVGGDNDDGDNETNIITIYILIKRFMLIHAVNPDSSHKMDFAWAMHCYQS